MSGRWRANAGNQSRSTALRNPSPAVPADSGVLTMFGALQIEQPMRIVRMLKARTDEHFRTFAEDVDRAVAVVNVEIEDRDALDAGLLPTRACAPSATLLKKQNPIA